MDNSQLKQWIKHKVTAFVENSNKNRLHIVEGKAWKSPIVGVAAGDNDLFLQYKSMIGDFYWTPVEVLGQVYPDISFDVDKISVISWILPQTDQTILDQRKEKTLPADRWTASRYYGEKFNDLLRQHLVTQLKNIGIKSVAPCLLSGWDYRVSEKEGIASNWSERHVAFAAGLGTFGLSDGFITEVGMAVRIGSVIVDAVIESDSQNFTSHMSNCLFISSGKCGACIKRCPANAITIEGHDKELCKKYLREVTAVYAQEKIGLSVTPCGLCQVKVPCEQRNPVRQSNY